MGIYYFVLIIAKLIYEKYYQLKGKRIHVGPKVKNIINIQNSQSEILISLLKENGNYLVILNKNN